ncbi:transcription factor kayak [Tetranychus urticae]|uniref:BZIP domain-containing protein n=1 Tax=Tetranychus urticae TaxID=32264 RepID=T1KTM0_TETUR|nr:transcription factor kayak [Tetranychus urticae]
MEYQYQYQAGFVPPTVSPFVTNYNYDSQFDSDDLSRDALPSFEMNPQNYNNNNGLNEEVAGGDEEERKRIRRERNKQAAARCRQRRIEYTNRLAQETEEMALGNMQLRNTLHELMQLKAELEESLQVVTKRCAFV